MKSDAGLRACAAACGLALLVVYVLRQALAIGNPDVPGVDAGTLYAWESYTRAVLASGELPHWNPYISAGVPHLANTQTLVLYPPAIALRWLPIPAFLWWMLAFHLWLAGTGAMFLGRVIGLGWIAAAAAAVGVMLGGSVAPWLYHGHLLIVFCTAWLPWALALSILSVRRSTVLPHPGLVAVLVLQFLAGYVQGSVYIAAVVCLYHLYSVAWPEEKATRSAVRWHPLFQLAVLGLVTLGLSAFQLLPLTRFVAEAGRTAGLPYSDAVADGWSFHDLVTLVFPFDGMTSGSEYARMPDRAYVGCLFALIVPAAVFDRRRRRLAVFCVLIACAATALALGDALPFYRLHYLLLPGFRIPGRLLFLTTLALAMLGAIGLERLVALATHRQWRAVALTVAAGVLVLAAATGFVQNADAPLQRLHAVPLSPLLMVTALIVIVCVAARGWPRYALAAGAMVAAFDVTTFAAGGVHTVRVEPEATLTRWLDAPVPGRALSLCENRIAPGGLLVHRQAAFGALVGTQLRGYAEWLNLMTSDLRPSDSVLGRPPLRRDLLDAANVSLVIACEPVDAPALTLTSRTDAILVYRNDNAWPRVLWTCEEVERSHEEIAGRLRSGRYLSRTLLFQDERSVNVRWIAGTSDEQRKEREDRYGLYDGIRREGNTWRYALGDRSPSNVLALLRDPAVEDTHGIDRPTGTVQAVAAGESDSRPRERLIGAAPCTDRGTVRVMPDADDVGSGNIVADVEAPRDGMLFVNELYYPERHAFVDGVRVEPLKANVAFTAVQVTAGRHRVELRYVPTSFHLGIGMSGGTLAAWFVGFRVDTRRRRTIRRSAEPAPDARTSA